MSSGTVCGQTPILDLAAGVREHLAAKCESIVEMKKINTNGTKRMRMDL